MSRLQLAINVNNLDLAIDFYAKLFGAEPAKHHPGYANFVLSDPPLKLVLLENPGQGGTLNHLGVEVDSTTEVAIHQTRLASEVLLTKEEKNTTCCYARQDKFWVAGPDDERWEYYVVLADRDAFTTSSSPMKQEERACCTPAQ